MSTTPWHGSVLASGFIFDEALLGRAELVRRLLGLWADRSRLGHAGGRWYLLGATPRQVDSRLAPGAPLVLREGRWLMGPADDETVRAAPMDSILELVASERRITTFSSLAAVHPAELIELATPSVLEAQLLAPPPQPVVTKRAEAPTLDAVFAPLLASLSVSRPVQPPPAPPRPTLRARLGAWLTARAARRAALPPPPAPTAREARPPSRLGAWFSGLFRGGRERPALPRRPSTPLGVNGELDVQHPPRAPTWLDRLGQWLTPSPGTEAAPPSGPGLLDRLGRWLTPATPPAPPRDPPPAPRAQQPGWLANALRNFFQPRPNPDKQREYLDDLRRRFSMGDLGEALRRAIPLGGSGLGGALATIPARRDELSLFGAPAIGGPSMVMPTDEYAAMKKLYRESADALVAKGQIEEAAYVLAKLLNDGAAAVALLEKHGKLELAAQLATAQHLPEVERIRLWLLLGRHDEAIRIARGSSSFATLVGALSTRAPDLARQLRGVWGDFLAERRQYTEAIVVTSVLPQLPAPWDTWVSRSLEAGGAAAATALAVDVARRPEHEPGTRAQLSTLLANDEQARLTGTAAEAFLAHAPKAGGPLYRDLWRRLMRGASSGHRVDRALADRVLAATADQTLAVDAVKTAPQAALRAREPLELPAPVVPGIPVLDVAPLPKRRQVLAHGAAGLRVVSANGETTRHLLVKADQLVAGPPGAGVLVISVDGTLTRVWKLDPNTLELTSWFQARLSAFSRRYDGLCWAVGMEDALVFLDPSAASPMEWWRVPNTECRALDASGSRVIALGTALGQRESWRYVFNAGTQQLQVRHGPDTDAWVRGDAVLPWELKLREDGQQFIKLGTRTFTLPTSPWTTFPMEAGLVLTRVVEGDTEVRLVPWTVGEPAIVARLSRTSDVRCRDLSGDRLALCDEHGRVTTLDLS